MTRSRSLISRSKISERQSGLDTSGGVSEELSEPNAAYATELNAACQNLRAQKFDFERLLVPIHGMQVCSLLKQTWLRLEALRAS